MKKGIKNALFFTSGAVLGVGVCGVNLISCALGNDDIRTGIKNAMSKKIEKLLYGDKVEFEINRKVIFKTSGEAENVLSQMNRNIELFGYASVADLFDIVGVQGTYSDSCYVWTDLRNANVVRLINGYMICFPSPIKM